MNYKIGDFLIRLKNAASAGHSDVRLPATKLIEAVAKVLKDEGILRSVETVEKEIVAHLAFRAKSPVLADVRLISKPGLRVYMGKDELAGKRGASFYIISTPQGVVSSQTAISKGIGGEVIAQVW